VQSFPAERRFSAKASSENTNGPGRDFGVRGSAHSFVQNSLKRGEVRFFPKNIRVQVTAIAGIIKSASFVRSGRSRHVMPLLEKRNYR